jgi:phosphatidylglycerophosphate synthase
MMTSTEQRDHAAAGRDGVVPPDRMSYRAALAGLRSAQKSSKGAPAYSRFVNRRLGRLLAAAAYRLGMTPNGVTAVSAAFSFAAIAGLALFQPTPLLGLLVTLGLVVGYALDAADGQLARLRGGGSSSGEWLDHMIDATKISSLHLAVLISAYRFFGLDDAWLLVPIGFTVVAAVSFFGMTLNDQLRRNTGRARVTPVAQSSSPLRSLLVLPTDYGVLCLIFLALGWPAVFFTLYTALFAGCAIFLVLAARKWFGDMRDLDSGGPNSG